MSILLQEGNRTISIERTRKGYRVYKVRRHVICTTIVEQALILSTPGLPQPGDEFDQDPWCFATLEAKVTMVDEKENTFLYFVDQTFTNDPAERRCMTEQVDDPLLVPPDISIEGIRFSEEATTDRFGRPLTYSSHERIRGAQVEFDRTKGQVRIEQNIASYTQAVILPMLFADTVNAFPLWGFPRRSIKLNSPTIRKRFYGRCSVYWSRILTFDIARGAYRHDRMIMDEGQRFLRGAWDAAGRWQITDLPNGDVPDPSNPKHFVQATDLEGNPISKPMPMNGAGLPAGVVAYRGQPTAIKTYICINNHESNGTSHTITSPTDWVEFGLGEAPWEEEFQYNSGDVVSKDVVAGNGAIVDTKTFVSLIDINDEDPYDFNQWLVLPRGITGRGEWKEGYAYLLGDVVRTPKDLPEESGNFLVEGYNESDFLYLGIPARLDT